MSVVIKSCNFWFLGYKDDGECLKQEGTSHSSSDLLKINVKMDDSWTAQALRQSGETPSGPLVSSFSVS